MGSDMCHHCKGDTWHVHAMTWHVCTKTRGRARSVDRADRWVNRWSLLGIRFNEWRGATWPRHGLPHGTHGLVQAFFAKIL
jgi:hypothetical protein